MDKELRAVCDAADKEMCDDFKASGSVYPAVTADSIAALMDKVQYHTELVGNTTTINATAVLVLGEGKFFTLGTASTACADPRNFNAEKGAYYAKEKAAKVARDKLWELEGYALFKSLLNSK